MKVFVYFNLHEKCWSVKALSGQYKGKVIAHARRVIVRDATLKVSEVGRQRVIREQRKNVHAGVVGELEGMDTITERQDVTYWWTPSDARYAAYAKQHGNRVTYNPYHHATFMELSPIDGQITGPIFRTPMAVLSDTLRVFDPCTIPEDA